ncbi:MAG: oxygen tolerance domain protein [Pantoea sp.]|uniref:oxygen tolerance domain protein n=1 Tax=Pantoea sp. TaxID=69393 RepID=UPI0039E6DB21
MKAFIALLLLWLPVAYAEMDVTRELVAPDHLVPGQPATVAITFWTDSWFNPAPDWPVMPVENGNLLNATPPNQLVSRQSRGISWSGVRLERKVVAWDQGELHLPALEITLHSSGQPPKTVQLTALARKVSWPSGVEQPDRFLPASSLSLQQEWQTYPATSDKQLHVGDVVERIVTLKATDVTSSQIPTLLYAIPGSETQKMAVQNTVLTRGRDEQVGVARVERLRYLPTQPGSLSIPPLQLRWWDTTHQQWQQAILPGAQYRFVPARDVGSEKILRAKIPFAWASDALWLLLALLFLILLWFCRQPLFRACRFLWQRIRFIYRVIPLPNLIPDRRKS